MAHPFHLPEEKHNEIYEYWLAHGSSQKEIALALNVKLHHVQVVLRKKMKERELIKKSKNDNIHNTCTTEEPREIQEFNPDEKNSIGDMEMQKP